MTRIENLQYKAGQIGLVVSTYSPGDGVTRYRFAWADTPQAGEYFGCQPVFTALGIRDAHRFINAALIGASRYKAVAL